MDVVAPSSAPILVIVALPVQLIDFVPGPKYSIIDPVPPDTVRIPASFKMTSLADVHPLNLPVNLTPINFGQVTPHGNPAITSTASAPPTPIAIMPKPPALG